MKRIYMTMLMGITALSLFAANVKVAMNSTSKTMTLNEKATGAAVETGVPSGTSYEFETDPGTYVLTAYGTDGKTVNGTIEINVRDTDEQQLFTVLTCTAYATNSGWTEGKDYTLSVDVNSREGVAQVVTIGNSTTAGRKTFLALNGNSYYAAFTPSTAHQAEGYMTLYRAGTLTGGVTVSGAIPVGADYSVTLPANAEFSLGIKFTHFTVFPTIEPTGTTVSGDMKTINYRLANGQVYNYRTWCKGGLTQGGYFTMNTDPAKLPVLSFTSADYAAFGAKTVKHDVKWNGGYETGDIFVNINERGHLKMNVGDTFDAHAMRSWELTDNSTNNYFIEPDFHYTVINTDGTPSTGVIEIDNADTSTSPWSQIKAVGNGTAIVLVTYDAIGLNFYASDKTDKTTYMGGEYWSAIWPENTAAYVVTVGEGNSTAEPNMVVNEAYNTGTLKNSGKYVDAEHDVFYYLDTEAGYTYTFTPSGVASVELAYPVIGTQMATYRGFATDGVTRNDDGSYSLLLKEGRQIVRLTDQSGNSVYQVLTAKTCHREITVVKRPDSKIIQRGDQVKIQYSGLRHPANKMAGIYNMSGYVTYNGIPNGSSLILGSGQYTFGSAASAQAVSVDIPADYEGSQLILNDGVIQVNGYGDPIGNHRIIDKVGGRSANFTALAHKTYFGAIPDVVIPVSETRNILATVNLTPANAGIIVKDPDGKIVTKNADGKYPVTLGIYAYEAKCDGYNVLRGTFTVADDAPDEISVDIALQAAADGAWDGKTMTEPMTEDGVYQIMTGAHLAWFANNVNVTKNYTAKAVLCNDIDLAGHDWTPIGGTSSSTAFKGTLDGLGCTVSGIYVNTTATYKGFFGYTSGATIKNLTVVGDVISTANYAAGVAAYANASTISNVINRVKVSGKMYVGGITAYAFGATTIDRCGNEADITGTGNYVAGVTPYLSAATTVVSNCYNSAVITGSSYVATVSGNVSNKAGVVKNCLALGSVECAGANSGNVYANTQIDREGITNNYVIENYTCGEQYETKVTAAQLASGEVAYRLGEAWGQQIGVDAVPVLGGMEVFYDKASGTYCNELPVAAAVADFEDVEVDATGICTPEDDEDETCYWNSGDYTFTTYTDDWGTKYYYDFVVTNSTSDKYASPADQYNSAAAGAKSGSNYAVWYTNFYGSEGIYAPDAMTVSGFYVTNTAWVVDALINGDGMSPEEDGTMGKPFGYKGAEDKLTLRITGYDIDFQEAGTVDYTLAEVKNDCLYYVKDWRWVDLTSLGANVVNIQFSIVSTKQNDWGATTPAYFCMDDFGGTAPETDAEMEKLDLIDTGISDVNAAAAANIERFDILGRRTNVAKGIQLVRNADGKVRKIIVK